MVGTIVAFVVIPLVMAGMARWAAARRRRGLAAGRAVHFRGRLDGRRGRLLADPRLEGPVFLDRAGNATAVPRGGRALDATISSANQPALEKVGLRYRTPDGTVLHLHLATHDARTLGSWLGEQPGPAPAPARWLPVAPLWAALALTAALLVGLAAADVVLLGEHTAAEVVRVHRHEDGCTVRWNGGAQQAYVDCDAANLRPGDRTPVIALPWPFLGDAVDTRITPTVAAVTGGGLGLLGLAGALLATPLACARRVRLARRAAPTSPQPAAVDGTDTDEGEDTWPSPKGDLTYASLAAAARHSDRHRPGPRVSPPRRRPDRLSVSPRRWTAGMIGSTGAWWFLVVSIATMFGDDLDDLHLGRWRFLVLGTVAVTALARIGWVTADRSALWRPVLRAARSHSTEDGWQPMRYVRLRRGHGEMALVLFRPEGGEVTAPRCLQPISRSRGSERGTFGGPGPVGEALIRDSGAGALVCEIDGIRYLPSARATETTADPGRARTEVLSFAESHLRPAGRN